MWSPSPADEARRRSLTRRAMTASVAVVILSLLTASAGASPATSRSKTKRPTRTTTRAAGPALARRCPWATAAAQRDTPPVTLANEVLAQMTLTEKLGFLDLHAAGGFENRSTAIARLCLPALTLQDGPNGLAYGDTGVTQLPSSLGIAASFNPGLAREYGIVEGVEARGQGIDVVQGPNLNIDRVPQNGRAFEAYGEDSFLTSQMAIADITGIQSTGTMANAKHFTAYTQEIDRLSLNQSISMRALQEIYLAPFKAAVVDAKVASVMCAYGQLNAVYDCQDPKLFSLLNRTWGFNGFVRSDLSAVKNPVAAFNAGLDVIKPAAITELTAAVVDHNLSMATIDAAARRRRPPEDRASRHPSRHRGARPLRPRGRGTIDGAVEEPTLGAAAELKGQRDDRRHRCRCRPQGDDGWLWWGTCHRTLCRHTDRGHPSDDCSQGGLRRWGI